MGIIFENKKKEISLALFCVITTSVFFIGLMEWVHVKKKHTKMHTQFDQDLGWIPIPEKKIIEGDLSFSYNSLGFRSKKIDRNKRHILVVGDSIAWGYGVDDKETFPYLLGRRFLDFQALNMGVNGYGIDQYFLRLKQHINNLNPSLVIIIIYPGNDIQNTQTAKAYGKSKPLFRLVNHQLYRTNPNLSKYSCANLFSGTWLLTRSLFSPLQKFCEIDFLNLSDTKEVIAALFQKIKHLSEDHGAKPLFIISPSLYDLKLKYCENSNTNLCQMFNKAHHDEFRNEISHKVDSNSEYFPLDSALILENQVIHIKRLQRLHWGAMRIIKNIFESERISYYDHFQYLLENGKNIFNISKLYKDTHHYSPEGHRLLADITETVINKNKLLNPSR